MTVAEAKEVQLGDTIYYCDKSGRSRKCIVVSGDSSALNGKIGLKFLKKFPQLYFTPDQYKEYYEDLTARLVAKSM